MLAERAKGYADLFGTSLDDMRAMLAATETAVSMAELAEISA
jgi:hypothetical protein